MKKNDDELKYQFLSIETGEICRKKQIRRLFLESDFGLFNCWDKCNIFIIINLKW